MKKSNKIIRRENGALSKVGKIKYNKFLDSLKTRIRSAQIKASLAVNKELVYLYWHTGQDIVQKQISEGWGKSVVERLSNDLKKEFPSLRGFSSQNMWRMRAFYLAWKVEKKALQRAYRELGRSKLAQPVRVFQTTIFSRYFSSILAQRVREIQEKSTKHSIGAYAICQSFLQDQRKLRCACYLPLISISLQFF